MTFALIGSSCSSETESNLSEVTFSESGDYVQSDSGSVVREESASTGDRSVSVYLNGQLSADGAISYTSESGIDFFSLGVAPTDNEVVALSVVVAADSAKAGLSFGTDELRSGELNETTVLCFVYINAASGEQSEYYASVNPEMFDNISFKLNSYNSSVSADFSLGADVTLNGKTYSLSASGPASYTASGNSDDSFYDYSDGTCMYCSGSGICQTCNGLGYTAWGGADSRIDCTTCDGLGSCYYCQGTGIQVYATRGVLIQ